MVPKNVNVTLDVEENKLFAALKAAIEAKTGLTKLSNIAAFRYAMKFTLDNINKH